MYHAFALLMPDNDLTLADLAKKLQAKFPNIDVNQHGDEITLSKGDWDYQLALQSGPNVLDESESLAGRMAGLDEDSPIRECDQRVNVWSDTPDPFMEHFDDHFLVLDILRGYQGVILVDPSEPTLL